MVKIIRISPNSRLFVVWWEQFLEMLIDPCSRELKCYFAWCPSLYYLTCCVFWPCRRFPFSHWNKPLGKLVVTTQANSRPRGKKCRVSVSFRAAASALTGDQRRAKTPGQSTHFWRLDSFLTTAAPLFPSLPFFRLDEIFWLLSKNLRFVHFWKHLKRGWLVGYLFDPVSCGPGFEFRIFFNKVRWCTSIVSGSRYP